MARSLLHPLTGGLPLGLVRTLRVHGGFSVRHTVQIAVMLLAGVLRAPYCGFEALRTTARAAAATFDPPPVVIVGHWRSGTTYLHHLMSADKRFCYPTLLDALRPYDFYPSPFEPISRAFLLLSLPETRPMDDIPLRPDLPQEDEMALATMAAPSFFNCFYFPRMMSEIFEAEVLFIGAPQADIDRWEKCLRLYLGKLVALHPDRRLLLKNPAHSARIPRLRSLFPGAKFVHIHRDPLDVLESTVKLYRSMLPVVALQDYETSAIDAHVERSYSRLMDRLLAGLAALPASDVAEVRYSDLVESPIAVLRAAYDRLGLPGFGHAEAAINARVREQTRKRLPDALARVPRSPATMEMLASYRARLGYGGATA